VDREELEWFAANTIRIMRALALALAATGALAACGGSSGGARTLPAVTSSPAASPSATAPAVAAVPAEATAATSAGAEAFAKFFYAQVQRAFEAKDPEIVRVLGAPGCGACDAYVASITKLRDNNERVEGYALTVFDAIAPAVTGPRARVDVSWTAPVVKRLDANGKVIRTEGPFRRVNEQVELLRSGDQWRVQAIKSLGKS
jgi:hypothetical protein